MEAKLRNEGEYTVITIQGPLSIEKTQPFRELCLRHLLGRKVIFNMEKTSFVGSTGLQAFFETVRSLSEESQHGLKLVGLQAEFKRIFQNMEFQKLQMHESEAGAFASFQLQNSVIVD